VDLFGVSAHATRTSSSSNLTELRDSLAPNVSPEVITGYIDLSGTSQAAPHVSGAIAAFLSIRREFVGQPERVKKIFTESATSLGRERYFQGHGLIDLMRAIQAV
jgi:serine protease AprX